METSPGTGVTRRRALRVTAGAALVIGGASGCGLFDSDPEPLPGPDPMQPVLDEALALTIAYDRAVLADPERAALLTPLAEDHRVHAAELARLINRPTPSAPGPSASTAAVDRSAEELRELERTAQRTATTLARVAPPETAGLLASIAACRASHVEALR